MADLPPAVQRQVEAAEALLAEANKTVTPTEPPATPPVEPPAEVQVPPPAQAVAEPTPPPAQDTWEQRYKSLQGLFNSRVNELQGQSKALVQQLQAVQDRLDTLSQKPQSTSDNAPVAAPDPKDVDNFGEDLVEMVRRQTHAALSKVAERVDAVVVNFEKRISSMEQALKGTTQAVASTAEEVFFGKLAQLVPDWQAVNEDERFLAWLAEVDPVYGKPRQAALTDAQNAMDVNRVANVFKAFKGTIPQTPKVDPLAKQVSPKSAAATAPQAPTEKPVITQQQVQAFYHDVATGRYRGRDAEAVRLEQMINEAMAEGRIR